MGRLSALTAALIAVSCNDPSKGSSGGRSEQVVTSATASASSSAASVAPEHVAPRGPLCDRSITGRILPKSSAAFVDSTGTVSDRPGIAWDGKRFHWVSFFASWCGPCKEEIPRIQRFAKKLEASGVPVDVQYVSIDDDLRQLTAFLAQQPEGGLKSAYWLKDGAPRNVWMASLKMKSEPPLPEHAIFDGRANLKCFVSGAIEEGDYAELALALK
jgi:thiol-disulfide isomerase/thioredoxin